MLEAVYCVAQQGNEQIFYSRILGRGEPGRAERAEQEQKGQAHDEPDHQRSRRLHPVGKVQASSGGAGDQRVGGRGHAGP